MAKLTDKQRKKIIAESVEGSSTRALAAKYHVSQTTIRRVLQSDSELAQKVSQKKEENTQSVLAHMESKKNDVCALIDKMLVAMNDDAKIKATPLSQIATAMGIVIDKYTAHESATPQNEKATNFFEALHNAGKEVDLSAIPEIQSAAASDADMVDAAGPKE